MGEAARATDATLPINTAVVALYQRGAQSNGNDDMAAVKRCSSPAAPRAMSMLHFGPFKGTFCHMVKGSVLLSQG